MVAMYQQDSHFLTFEYVSHFTTAIHRIRIQYTDFNNPQINSVNR